MNELQEIIRQASLTKTQQKIANYILDYSSEACFMTSTEIARKINVSESSIIRFSRSLGFSGFIAFQKALQKQYQDKVHSISSSITVPAQRLRKRAHASTSAEYLSLHFKNALKNMEMVFSDNSSSVFEAAADLIIAGKRKYIVASRGNSCLGDYFLLYLKHMLPNVETTSSSSISPLDHICSIKKDDCLIAFSFPRYSSTDCQVLKMAKDSGAGIVLITDKPSALLCEYASILLTVPVDSNSFFNCMVAPQFVTEALLETISHKVTGIQKRLDKIDTYLQDLGSY